MAKRATKPKINNVLNMFEPTTFPTDISILFEIALVILTESSGRLVPSATIVRPIKMLGIFSFLAIALAADTKKSAPLISSTIPIIKNRIFKKIVMMFFLCDKFQTGF